MRILIFFSVLWALLGCVATGSSDAMAAREADAGIAHPVMSSFFVGGSYEVSEGKKVYSGQMFVREWRHSARRRYPAIVLIHGVDQTGLSFLKTPDGRGGWAGNFFSQGYDVYIVDQVGRGMSGMRPSIYGAYSRRFRNLEVLEKYLTAPELFKAYPQAHLHSRWPDGPGIPGNPSFDRFAASQVDSLTDDFTSERLMRAALEALLLRIGPSILLTHSQSGTFGWTIADDRPDLVRALVAVEPNGPPFYDIDSVTKSEGDGTVPAQRAWGLTRLPLHYQPSISEPAALGPTRDEDSSGNSIRCWQQRAPVHRLPRLASVPILIVTADASFHALYDQCTARFLIQAGVPALHMELGKEGITGTGHMMMLETESERIADVIATWLRQHIK